MSDVRTFRGRALEEVLAEIRAELGPEAVVVGRREVLDGGVGGFFARRRVEVDARAARGGLDVAADEPALPEPVPAEPGPEPELPSDPELVTDAQPVPEPAAANRSEFLALLRARQDEDARLGALPDVAAAPDAESVPAPMPEPEPEPAPEPEPEPEPAPAPVPTPRPAAPAPASARADPASLVAPATEADLDLLVDVAGPPAPSPDPDDAASRLARSGLSPALAATLQEEAARAGGDELDALRQALAARLRVAPLRPAASGHVLALVGANGVGKTRATAALATAYATRSSLPVAVVALRPDDGGTELAALLEGLPVEARIAADGAEAAALAAELRAGRLVVVDTPGASPRDDAAGDELAAELAALRPDDVVGCVPAHLGAAPALDVLAALERLGVTAVALTHADETTRYGAALEAVVAAGLPLALVGRSSSPRTGLRPAVASELAAAVLA